MYGCYQYFVTTHRYTLITNFPIIVTFIFYNFRLPSLPVLTDVVISMCFASEQEEKAEGLVQIPTYSIESAGEHKRK